MAAGNVVIPRTSASEGRTSRQSCRAQASIEVAIIVVLISEGVYPQYSDSCYQYFLLDLRGHPTDAGVPLESRDFGDYARVPGTGESWPCAKVWP